MNEIITLEMLAERLAGRAGISIDEARDYITSLQHSLSASLAASNTPVAIAGVGTFSVRDRKGGEIAFEADTQLAETVNEPFSCFEPVTLSAPVDEIAETAKEMEAVKNETPEAVGPEVVEPEAVEPEAVEPEADESKTVEHETVEPEAPDTQSEEVVEAETPVKETPQEPLRTYYRPVADTVDEVSEPESKPESEEPASTNEEVDQPEPEYEELQATGRSMSPLVSYILGILTGMILTCVIAYFLYPSLSTYREYTEEYVPEEEENVEIADVVAETEAGEPVAAAETVAETAVAESAEPQAPAPANEPADVVTDTVGQKYYLASMARKHYGEMIFWVYIYAENESNLGHPDRVPPGTVVVIPPASKYNIDRNDPASIERAQREQARIYAKFK